MSTLTSPNRWRSPIFSLLVFPTILALLSWSIMYVREASRTISCQSNLRELSYLIINYAAEHEGQLPDGWEDMAGMIPPEYLRFMVCKEAGDAPPRGPTTQAVVDEFRAGGHVSYVYLGRGRTMRSLKQNTPLVYDPHPHDGKMLFLFADGHSEALPHARAVQLLQQLADERAPPATKPTSQPAR
jgi:prepilin-type processing-associated H-X9-DG protein